MRAFEKMIEDAVRTAFDDGATEQEFVARAKAIAAEEAQRRTAATAEAVYGKGRGIR